MSACLLPVASIAITENRIPVNSTPKDIDVEFLKYFIVYQDGLVDYTGPAITVLQFHRLCGHWEDWHLVEPAITLRKNDEFIYIEKGYKLSDETLLRLHSGTIQTHDGEVYSSMISWS